MGTMDWMLNRKTRNTLTGYVEKLKTVETEKEIEMATKISREKNTANLTYCLLGYIVGQRETKFQTLPKKCKDFIIYFYLIN